MEVPKGEILYFKLCCCLTEELDALALVHPSYKSPWLGEGEGIEMC